MKQVKLNNSEIQAIVRNLSDQNSLLNSNDQTKKVAFSILWRLDGNFRKLSDISSRVDDEINKINSKYLDDKYSYDDEGGRRVKPEYLNDYNSSISEVLSTENEIEISTVTFSELDKYDLVPSDFQSIRFMIEEDDLE